MVAILMQPSILAGCMASRASLSRSLGTACLNHAVVLLYGTFFMRRHWTRKEHDCGGGGAGGFYIGEAMERDGTGMNRRDFAMPRARAAQCSPLSEGWSCVIEW